MYSQTAITGFLAAHPVSVLLVTAIAVGAGGYYLGKMMAEKAAKSTSDSSPAAENAASVA